jgi:repressor LexA
MRNAPKALVASMKDLKRFQPLEAALDRRADGRSRCGTETQMVLVAQGAAQGLYTGKQGQYLAFIYYYTKIHGCSPSEADMQGYFRVSPASVHQMVLSLEKLRFIERTPGRGRSLKLLLRRDQLPDLL